MEEYWVVDDSVEGFKDGAPTASWATLELWFREQLNPWDQLSTFFMKYDDTGFGEMLPDRYRSMIVNEEFRGMITELCGEEGWRRLQTHSQSPRSTDVTYQEFVDVLSNKRRRSFKVAVHQRDGEVTSVNNFTLERQRLPLKSRMAYRIADEFLSDPHDRKFYADRYKCCPPPLFVPLITIAELGFFVYYAVVGGGISAHGPVPVDSLFIYRPDKRAEIWRYFLYIVLHAGWIHLLFNLIVQVLVGLPLEMVHGSGRVATVYAAGVLAGSLGTSVFDSDVYLVGASGGVYALLAAHASNVLLNYSQIECAVIRIFAIIVIGKQFEYSPPYTHNGGLFSASADVGFAIWDRYASPSRDGHPVSYVAHLAGALAGLTIGLLVLRNFEQRLNEQFVWWVALSVYGACMLTAIIWNIFFL